ncbi:MAG: rod shape-determining protein MreC [Acidobacteria bacterium]|nr:rod shape-determining protein MreC [Acidobacteriota bacterium]
MLRSWSIGLLAPLMSGVSGFGSGASEVWENYADIRRAQEENRSLRSEVEELRRQLQEAKESGALNERLKASVRLQERLPARSILARVIGRDVTGWHQTVILNRGSQDGVPMKATVLSRTGLVGRVVSLQPYSAQAQLITDERSGAGAIIGVLGDSRAIGVVEGKNEQLCKMRYVPGSQAVNEGEWVFTTGQDGIYPRGIPIGRVVSVLRGSAMVSHDIAIEPAAALGKLEEVIILLDRPDQIDWSADEQSSSVSTRLP